VTTLELTDAGPVYHGRWTPPCDKCPTERVSRPYSRKRKSVSVTTLVDKLPKDGLMWGAAKETAIFAVQHQSAWRGLDEAEAIERLRTHFRGVWDASADVGTLTHTVNEHWIDGLEMDPADPKHRERLHKAKDDDTLYDQLLDRMPGYVEGLGKFWQAADPQTIATEVVLRTGDVIGTTDWITHLPGLTDGVRFFDSDVWILDVKTTSELDPEKGMYPDAWRPQLFMYATAREVVHFHGTDEVAAWPMEDCFPRPNRAGILHLRGDGLYQLIEVDITAPLLPELVEALKVVHRWGLTAGYKTPAPVVVSEATREAIPPRPSAPASPGMLS
jgi:hypothetical protein